MTQTKQIGSLQIIGLGKMGPRGHRDVADWLIRQARSIRKDGPNYANRFRARYSVNVQCPPPKGVNKDAVSS